MNKEKRIITIAQLNIQLNDLNIQYQELDRLIQIRDNKRNKKQNLKHNGKEGI